MQRKPEPEVMDESEEARVYDLADFGEVNQAFVNRLLPRIESAEPAILDLGTGPADIPMRLCKALRTCRIVAVDSSAAMLERAARRLAASPAGPAIRLLRADAKQLPLPQGAYDAVISNSLLHHLREPRPFWDEIKQVVRPDGVILVEDLYRPETPEQARNLVELHSGQEPQLLKDLFYQSFLAAFSVEEVRHQLSDAGLARLVVTAIDDRHLMVCDRAF